MNPLSRQRKEIGSAAITQSLGLIVICSALFALTSSASQPGWWTTRNAVVSEQIVTNSGVVTTNYVPNDFAAFNQGQLKSFTEQAVAELNADLPGGAGT